MKRQMQLKTRVFFLINDKVFIMILHKVYFSVASLLLRRFFFHLYSEKEVSISQADLFDNA